MKPVLQPRRVRRTRKRDRLLTKSEQMARVRSRDTYAELAVRRALWARGLRYRLRPKLPGTPDIVFPGPKVAVFVDGCFWHGCPEHYSAPLANERFWQEKLLRNRRRDQAADASLRDLGWLALRVWEHDIRNLDQVVDRVHAAVAARRGT
jgi:DNA mismatch endonuclease (patch repair protein)